MDVFCKHPPARTLSPSYAWGSRDFPALKKDQPVIFELKEKPVLLSRNSSFVNAVEY